MIFSPTIRSIDRGGRASGSLRGSLTPGAGHLGGKLQASCSERARRTAATVDTADCRRENHQSSPTVRVARVSRSASTSASQCQVGLSNAKSWTPSPLNHSSHTSHAPWNYSSLRVHTVVATLSIERLRRLCGFSESWFGSVIG